MKSFAIPFCCLTLLGAAVFYNNAKVNELRSDTLAIMAERANAKPPLHMKADVWILSSPQDQRSCLIYHGAEIDETRRRLNVDSACNAMVDDISFAEIWNDLESDTVRFLSKNNQLLAEFGPTDGTAYVSRGLRNPVFLIPSP